MNALNDAGIYVIADLSVPGESINRDSPAWTTDLFARYTGVIDNLAQYQNTLGFFAGNEVTNNKTNSNAAAFVKAAVRDSKAYIARKNFGRWIGVGYATNDDAETRDLLANYFNCGTDQAAAVDFWGYNIYEWCGQSTFQASGYQERTTAFANYSVPAFFSEYGCNNPGGSNGRVFQDTPVLYSDLMNKVWSGGIVYEYFQEQNDFGRQLGRSNSCLTHTLSHTHTYLHICFIYMYICVCVCVCLYPLRPNTKTNTPLQASSPSRAPKSPKRKISNPSPTPSPQSMPTPPTRPPSAWRPTRPAMCRAPARPSAPTSG